MKFYHKLNFNSHIPDLCKKASKLYGCEKYSEKAYFYECFFKSQFRYCPLIRMCQSRKNNERIYKLHERCLRIMHWYFVIFWQTLEKTMALFPRTTETFRTGLSKSIMSDLFKMKSDPCYNLRNNGNFHIPSVNTVFNSFLTEVLTLKKPVHSFTLQIEGLVSIS